MTVTYLLTILVFGIVFILMSLRSLLKRDDRSTLTCSNGFADGIDTCFLCGYRGDACRQSGERSERDGIGQL